jgi:uncharacterized protein YbaR (Trm112 family)
VGQTTSGMSIPPFMEPELLALLCCPETRQPLRLAAPELVQRIRRERPLTRSGQPAPSDLDGGLVREDGHLFFPVCGGLPNLLLSGAVPL